MEENKRYADEALEDDAEITRDFDAKPLPAGDYVFTVAGCVIRQRDADEKHPKHRQALITLRVTDADGKKARTVKTGISLLKSKEARISTFLRSVGLKKVGETVKLSELLNCVGKEGKAHFYVSEDGRFNNLGYFLDPGDGTKIPTEDDGPIDYAGYEDYDDVYDDEEYGEDVY